MATRPRSILWVDDESESLESHRRFLTEQGYSVEWATHGDDALEMLRRQTYGVVLVDEQMPGRRGLELFGAIRELDPAVPVVMVTKSEDAATMREAIGLAIDDYLVKPLDVQEVIARVRAHIRRAQLKPALNPLTGLPGNLIIEAEIRRLTSPGHGLFAVLYTDLNHFKAYNDVYGFPAGDDAIRLVARVLTAAVSELGNPSDFVGHVGGDDFVVISTPDRCDAIAQRLIADFDRQVPELYTPADRRRGYLTTKDRQGMIKKFPLLSIALAIVHNQYHMVTSHWEIGELGAELKQYAKARGGSAYVKDQRRG